MTEPAATLQMNPAEGQPPDGVATPSWRLMLAHPAHWIAFGCGSGLLRPAPGTWGTLAGWFVFVTLEPFLSTGAWLLLITLTAVIGAWAAERTGRILGRPDHGAIVIDEIVAFWLVLLVLPPDLLAQALGFLAFRLFDILKPPPIRAVDRRFKSGFGVMADDLIAAFYALLLAAIAVRVLG
jgi:phosphatidylglycerophosphatase A